MIRTIQPGYITTQGFSTSLPTQELKPSFTTIYILIPNDGGDPTWFISTQGFSASMLTQGHKTSYTTSYILIPNDGDDPTWLYINTGFQYFNANTRT